MSQTLDPSTAERQGHLKLVSGKDGEVAPPEAPQGRRVLEVAAQEVGGGRPGRISHRTAQGHLRIEAWLDPVVEEMGHDPRSAYAEMYWLPVLGPSVTWMLRRFATYLEESPEGADLGLEELARSLGIGETKRPERPARPDAEALRGLPDGRVAGILAGRAPQAPAAGPPAPAPAARSAAGATLRGG